MGVLYVLTFPNGKRYVGQTTRKLSVRMAAHERAAMKCHSLLAVHCAWRKHGEPMVSILSEHESEDELNQAEIAAIQELCTLTPGGYNISFGGDTAPSKRQEVKDKIGAKSKGRKGNPALSSEKSLKLWQNAEYRKIVRSGIAASWTEERRSERSEEMKRIWAERKANGWTMPESQVQKMRAKKLTPEQIEAMRARMTGKKQGPRTEDTKRKIAEAIKSSWQDDDCRKARIASISEAHKRRHAEMSEGDRLKFAEARKQAWITRKNKAK